MPYNKPSMKGAYMYGATKPSMKHGAHMKSKRSGIYQAGLEKLMEANPEVTKKVAASLPMKGKPAICKHNKSK